MARDATYKVLMNSYRWRCLRNSYLSKHPMCEECARAGKLTPADNVHHKRPVESGQSDSEKTMLAYDVGNLMAVCRECHVLIHKGLGKGTRVEREERAKKEAEHFADVFFKRKTGPPGVFFKKGGGGT